MGAVDPPKDIWSPFLAVEMMAFRVERDSLGEVQVPENVLYGAQTQRAVLNFPISGLRLPPNFLSALGHIKWCAASVNENLKLLDPIRSASIRAAADEVAEGRWNDQFPVDVFQTGSGTSTNMNANEVIATRACQILVAEGRSVTVHPNDHVNMSQSSNDVFPTAIHVSAAVLVSHSLLPALHHLRDRLLEKANQYRDIVKTGRTHLMDATPMRVGHEIGGWSHQIGEAASRVGRAVPALLELAIGGTAVGTGLNAPAGFGTRVAISLAERLGLPFKECSNHFAAQSSMDAVAGLSGCLKTTAACLYKVANDVRWLSSGPVAGLGEMVLPPLQPGSSIMPGKVNPVVCEATMMACVQVMGYDVVVGMANSQGNFQLNTFLPLIAYDVLSSVTVLSKSVALLADLVVDGMVVNEDRVRSLAERNPMIVTSLGPVIGYDMASEIAHRSYVQGLSVRDVAGEMTNLSSEELDRLLDLDRLVGDASTGT